MTDTGPGQHDSRNFDVLAQALEQACLELMSDYGIPATVQRVEKVPPTGASLGAAIDFSSHRLRGTLTFRADQGVLAASASNAPGMKDAPSGLWSDWTCELANQLVGRIKTKLRSYDLTFSVNVPRPLPQEPACDPEHVAHYRFVCDCGSFTGYIDALLQPGLVLTQRSVPPGPVAEGELLMLEPREER